MTDTARALLPEYLLGILEPGDRALVEAALASDPALRAESEALAEALGAVPLAMPPVAPAPDVKARLLASAAADRFLPFAEDLARLCDLAVDKMKAVLRLVDRPDAWSPGPMPGIALVHFDHGSAALGADTGLVRMPAGFAFPKHRHHGPEVNYILEGALIDDDGTVYRPGDAVRKGEGDAHAYRVGDGEDLVMVVIHNGFEILG